jgi:hypothetical protein
MLWGLCAATVQQRGEPLTILAFPPVLRPPARHRHAAILHIYSLPQHLVISSLAPGLAKRARRSPQYRVYAESCIWTSEKVYF